MKIQHLSKVVEVKQFKVKCLNCDSEECIVVIDYSVRIYCKECVNEEGVYE